MNLKDSTEQKNVVIKVQGDTKKTVITKNRITSKSLFRLTQNFSYIRSSLCSRHLQSFKSVLQKLFVCRPKIRSTWWKPVGL